MFLLFTESRCLIADRNFFFYTFLEISSLKIVTNELNSIQIYNVAANEIVSGPKNTSNEQKLSNLEPLSS